ncbi:MAG: MBL fold metallo-hydrolase, partial [Angelakisella sp.]
MTQRRRRRRKKVTKSTWITLITALAAVLVVFLQPIFADYGIDLEKLLSEFLYGKAVQTTVYPSEGTAEVHFIDVGQASCILIKGSEKTALIDGAEAGTAPKVIEYLEQNGVAKIDYFFNTHPHSDHMGGCKKILEAVPTREFIMTDLKKEIVPTTVGYSKLIAYLGENKDSITASTA